MKDDKALENEIFLMIDHRPAKMAIKTAVINEATTLFHTLWLTM